MTPIELWNERLRSYWNKAMRYIRLMANSGLMIAVYVLLLIIGIYYQSFLDWLPAGFPVLTVFTVLFAFLLTRSSMRTFLKEGDLVFLLPLEGRLGQYMRKAFVYSWLWQSVLLFFLLFLLAPLYLDRLPGGQPSLLLTFIVLIAAKAWNIGMEWVETRQQFLTEHKTHQVLRFVVNVIFAFFIFQATWGFVLAIALLMVALSVLYYRPMYKKHGLKWEFLLDKEQQRLSAFYRLANSFTDVPQMKAVIRKRRFLANLLESIHHRKENTYLYLYGKTFVRTGDYFGLSLRLALVGALLIYAAPWEWMVFAVAGLFVYITGAQLATIYHHHDVLLWPEVYPLPAIVRRRAVKVIVRYALLIQTVWFAVVTAFISVPVYYSGFVLLLGLVVSLFYTEYQLGKELKAKVS